LGLVIPNALHETFIRTDSSINIFKGSDTFPEPSRRDCSSCEDLWRGYRDAMIAHLEAVDELVLAQLSQNSRKSMYLEGAVFRAERKREQAHGVALSHERTHLGRMAA